MSGLEWVAGVLYYLVLLALPPLAMRYFYKRENKRLIWLTIPVSALGLALISLLAMHFSDPEGWIGAIIIFPLHTAVVGIATVISALIRRKKSTDIT